MTDAHALTLAQTQQGSDGSLITRVMSYVQRLNQNPGRDEEMHRLMVRLQEMANELEHERQRNGFIQQQSQDMVHQTMLRADDYVARRERELHTHAEEHLDNNARARAAWEQGFVDRARTQITEEVQQHRAESTRARDQVAEIRNSALQSEQSLETTIQRERADSTARIQQEAESAASSKARVATLTSELQQTATLRGNLDDARIVSHELETRLEKAATSENNYAAANQRLAEKLEVQNVTIHRGNMQVDEQASAQSKLELELKSLRDQNARLTERLLQTNTSDDAPRLRTSSPQAASSSTNPQQPMQGQDTPSAQGTLIRTQIAASSQSGLIDAQIAGSTSQTSHAQAANVPVPDSPERATFVDDPQGGYSVFSSAGRTSEERRGHSRSRRDAEKVEEMEKKLKEKEAHMQQLVDRLEELEKTQKQKKKKSSESTSAQPAAAVPPQQYQMNDSDDDYYDVDGDENSASADAGQATGSSNKMPSAAPVNSGADRNPTAAASVGSDADRQPTTVPQYPPYFNMPDSRLQLSKCSQISLTKLDSVAQYKSWKARMIDKVVAASHALDPDDVRRWVGDVYRAKSMDDLYDPSPYPLVDTQIKDAMATVIDGTAKQKAQRINDVMAKDDKALRGRQFLWLMDDQIKIHDQDLERAARAELNRVVYKGNLEKFWHDWSTMLQDQPSPPVEGEKRYLFRKEIEKEPRLKVAFERHDHEIMFEGKTETYDQLARFVEIEIEMNKARKIRKDMQSAYDGKAAPAQASDGTKKNGVCNGWKKAGQCPRGGPPPNGTCPWTHSKSDKGKGKGKSKSKS